MKSQKATTKPTPPADLWAQMDAIAGTTIKDDPGVSVEEFAQRYRLSDSHARKKLLDLARQGKLIEGKRKSPTGWFLKVYRPA